METVLYIISKPAQSWEDYQIVLTPGPDQGHKTVVLLDEVEEKENLSADQIYQVNDRPFANKGTVGNAHSLVSISYRDLLDLIFTSDTSVVV